MEFDKLWDYNKPEETEKKFREILPEIESSGDRSAYLQLLTQIARTLGLQRKFDEAHKLLDETEPQLNDDDPVSQIRYMLERGRTFNSSGFTEKAEKLFLKAYKLGLRTGIYNYTVDAAHMMAIVKSGDQALRWNETAMMLAENSQVPEAKQWLGSLYNNTGWTYFEMKEYDKALELFEKCMEWHWERNTGQGYFIASWSVSKTLRMLGRVDEALYIQTELLKEIEAGKAEQDGYVYEELGECYFLKGNDEEAKKNFAAAYDMLSQDIWFAENEKERLQRLKELGGR